MNKFDNYKAIADSIATLLFPHAEVVIHDLASQTVAHIANNTSKRKLGDESALEDLAQDIISASNLGRARGADVHQPQPVGARPGA
jgi:predicted transcriptional regulator YheO